MGVLRLFLAVCVVFWHAHPRFLPALLPGDIAVELFFIISGFYMGMVLTGKYASASPAAFYKSRFLRLWPTFILVTVGCYVLWGVTALYLGHAPTGAPFSSLLSPGMRLLIQLSNLLMIGQDILPLFAIDSAGNGLLFSDPAALPPGAIWLQPATNIPQAWSIGTELWFYLLAPALVRLPTSALLGIAAASLGLRGYMGLSGLYSYYFTPCYVALFITGLLAQRLGPVLAVGSMVSTTMCLGSVLATSLYLGAAYGDPCARWLLFAAVAATLHGLFKVTRDSRLDRAVGELSYPLYMIHMLVLTALTLAFRRFGIAVSGELLLAIALPLAYALYHYVERPVDAYRQRRFVQSTARPVWAMPSALARWVSWTARPFDLLLRRSGEARD